MTGTVTLPDGRVARVVPADEAGEVYLRVLSHGLDLWRETGRLSPREADAADELGRLLRLSGLRRAMERGRGGPPLEEQREAAARGPYRAALAAAPPAARGPIQAMLIALADGSAGPQVPAPWLVRPGLQAVADHLRLPPD